MGWETYLKWKEDDLSLGPNKQMQRSYFGLSLSLPQSRLTEFQQEIKDVCWPHRLELMDTPFTPIPAV